MTDNPFCLISNNCWGAEVYRELNLPYNTPFVGLFVPPEDYITLLGALRENIHAPLRFVSQSRHSIYNRYRAESSGSYPIGLLKDNIEIHFLHYSSEQEARDKWNRRVARMTFDEDKVFVRFCDREITSKQVLKQFDELPFKYKVCFTAAPSSLKSTKWIYVNRHLPEVIDGKSLYNVSKIYFDPVKWVLTGSGELNRQQQLRATKINFKYDLARIKGWIKRKIKAGK